MKKNEFRTMVNTKMKNKAIETLGERKQAEVKLKFS